MLLEPQSIAFGVWELCFGGLGAMLSAFRDYVFRVWELCFSMWLAYSDWLRLSYYGISLIKILKLSRRRCLYICISGSLMLTAAMLLIFILILILIFIFIFIFILIFILIMYYQKYDRIKSHISL